MTRHLYAYGVGNPIDFTDPDGREAYGGTTWAEISYCLAPWHAYVCAVNVGLGRWATQAAERRYPRSPPNGREDAYRHCIWQGCLALILGPNQAQVFGDLHEQFAGNDPAIKRMDLHNNRVARTSECAAEAPPPSRATVALCSSGDG